MSNPTPQGQKSEFASHLEKFHIQPHWERVRSIVRPEPHPVDLAFHWKWSDMLPLIDRALDEVGMDRAERRVLMMTNPDFKGDVITTHNLIGDIQILGPNETAPPHRHTAAAIRFILEADGGFTTVDGKALEMRTGDLILTPSWVWHGHVNRTNRRVLWFDGLDVPLTRFNLDAFFLEPADETAPDNAAADHAEQKMWDEGGLFPATTATAKAYSPKLRYARDATVRALESLAPEIDGSRRLRYVNPLTGGAVMPTIDCYMLQLARGAETQPQRQTYNAICVVAEGEGTSTIGDRCFNWRRNDVFTIPHWTWASHTGLTDKARIFLMTDRECYARLDLLREERMTTAKQP